MHRPVQPDVIFLFAPQSPDDRRCAECGKDKTKVSSWRASKLKPGDWLCPPCANREVMHIQSPAQVQYIIPSDQVRRGVGECIDLSNLT